MLIFGVLIVFAAIVCLVLGLTWRQESNLSARLANLRGEGPPVDFRAAVQPESIGARVLAPLAGSLAVLPHRQYLRTEPQRQASTLHQRSVILPPVTETIPCLGFLVFHTSRLPAFRLRDYLCNKAL